MCIRDGVLGALNASHIWGKGLEDFKNSPWLFDKNKHYGITKVTWNVSAFFK